MGAQVAAEALLLRLHTVCFSSSTTTPVRMAPMKATQKAMGKGAIAEALANECELKKSVCMKVIGSLAEIASTEVSKTGIFTVPGLCRIKTRTKPATKAGKREVFGKVVMVKAKPARKVVKAYPVKALKDSI